MSLEIQRRKNWKLRSKYWYGRYAVNGQRVVVNLNIEIKGQVPAALREEGDIQFDRFRVLAPPFYASLASTAEE